MIITHAQNANGQRRIYLGGKSSLECWIEPAANGAWTFHLDQAVTGNVLSLEHQRACAIRILHQLAEVLQVHPAALKSVPFDAVAALHADDPFSGRRSPRPRHKTAEACYMATPPGTRPPKQEYDLAAYMDYQRRR